MRPGGRRRGAERALGSGAGQGGPARPRRGPARGRADRPSARAGATEASSSPRSPTGSPTASPASPTRCSRSSGSGWRTSTATVATIAELGIECGLELTGSLDVAVEPHELAWLAEEAAGLREHGHEVVLLDRERMRAEIDSPPIEAGLWQQTGPAWSTRRRLCWGLARAARELGVRIHEGARSARSARCRRRGRAGACRRDLAGPPGRARDQRLPRPGERDPAPDRPGLRLRPRQRAAQRRRSGRGSAGANRQGVGDSREPVPLLPPDRGRPDPLGRLRRDLPLPNGRVEQRSSSASELRPASQHFFTTFPQLEGIRFSHRWGGRDRHLQPLLRLSRHGARGRVAYTVGHTGLGVCASRFGARVALDLVDGRASEATRPARDAIASRCPFPPSRCVGRRSS